MKRFLAYSGLLRELVFRDLRARFLRPAFGMLWLFLLPALQTVILYAVFSIFLDVRTAEAPFFLYLMSSVFTWRFFSDSLTQSVTSLIDNKTLIKEGAFPAVLVPLAVVLSNALQALAPLELLALVSGLVFKGLSPAVMAFPLVFGGHICLAAGLAVSLSIAYVFRRDVRYILDAALQIMFYLTPCFYPLEMVKRAADGYFYGLYVHNPLTGYLTGYRCLFFKGFLAYAGGQMPLVTVWLFAAAASAASLLAGWLLYRHTRKTINDYLGY